MQGHPERALPVPHVAHELRGVLAHAVHPVLLPAALRALGEDRAERDLFLAQAHVRVLRRRMRETYVPQLARVVPEQRLDSAETGERGVETPEVPLNSRAEGLRNVV